MLPSDNVHNSREVHYMGVEEIQSYKTQGTHCKSGAQLVRTWQCHPRSHKTTTHMAYHSSVLTDNWRPWKHTPCHVKHICFVSDKDWTDYNMLMLEAELRQSECKVQLKLVYRIVDLDFRILILITMTLLWSWSVINFMPRLFDHGLRLSLES